MKKLLFTTVLSVLFFIKAICQTEITDSAITTVLLSPTYSIQIPSGDVAKQYGWNSTIGGSVVVKTKKNFIFGIDGNYIFGNNIKNEDVVFKNISCKSGFIIDENGEAASVKLNERGFHFNIKFGKLFNVLAPNPNSGILITTGAGFLQYKLRIEVENNTAAQIKDDYSKGYDRLTSGFALNEFIGYLYMGKYRVLNFYAGLELMQAWTYNRRGYNFDQMSFDKNQKSDYFYGIKVGWVIPIYKRMPDKYYYY